MWKSQDLRLTDEVKRTLAYASMEADAMGDGWVDTDHLLLGILRESACPGRKAIDRCRTYV